MLAALGASGGGSGAGGGAPAGGGNIWGQLGAGLPGVGSIALGAIGSKKAKKQRRARQQHGQLILDNLRKIQGGYGTQTEDKLLQAMEAITGGYEAAQAQTEGIGRGAKRRALDREQAGYGATQQALTSRGLASTTRQGTARRGVRADTDRALLDIDDMVARIQSGLLAQAGTAEAGALSNLGSFYQQRAAQDTAIEGKRFELFAGQGAGGLNQGAQTYNLSGLGPLIAMLGGSEGTKSYQDIMTGA